LNRAKNNRAEDRECCANGLRRLEAAMREEAVVADGRAEPGQHVEDEEDGNIDPGERDAPQADSCDDQAKWWDHDCKQRDHLARARRPLADRCDSALAPGELDRLRHGQSSNRCVSRESPLK
jgi:hypothetical protein